MCPLCLCGSFHPLALEKCILEYILPTKAGRAAAFPLFNITVFEANFENGEIESLNAIAGGLSCLKGLK
ncbi:hypothetical protein MICAI_1480004 [Microcystis sp. T1-4]|nr:hypothetical protein MICAI_1480004 [Microcystis sp. T1-4]